jgi:hypoxanthine phosphoribosyltransferase
VTTLFTAEQIHARIQTLAAEIDASYPDGAALHFVAVLKGAFIFLSDLARALPRARHARLHRGVELRSGHQELGRGSPAQGSRRSAQGRDVIIVEDIVDTG